MPTIDFSDQQESPKPIRAKFRTKCAYCGEWIEEDDWMVLDEDGNWIHEIHG